MFPRLCRYSRPLALRACRSFGSRSDDARQMWQHSPWRRFHRFDEFFPHGSSRRNWVRETERQFEDFFKRNSEFGFRNASGVQVTHNKSVRLDLGEFKAEYLEAGSWKIACDYVTHNKSVFEVRLDLGEFKAEDLEVKLTDSGRLQVRARHEQKQDDHGLVTRDFTREFDVPQDVDIESLTSTLSEEGWMTIRANVRVEPDKVIHIKRDN